MTKVKAPGKRELKKARNTAKLMQWDNPETKFVDLMTKADELYGTPEGRELDLVVKVLTEWSDTARNAYNKLMNDLDEINLIRLDDGGNTAGENMPHVVAYEAGESCIGYWPLFLTACQQVIACRAEAEGIDINAKLGYCIY